MPANPPAYQKRYKAKHYAENKDRYVRQASEQHNRLKQEIWDLKRAPCTDCGQSFPPWVMQFDHREGEVKTANVGTLLSRNSGRQRILDEIAKCDLVCANCHAERTYRRQHADIV